MSGPTSTKAPDWRLVDPQKIATECSPRHIQSVLEDARRDVLAAEQSAADLVRGARLLLASKSPHMTHRNANERKAYELLAAAVAKIDGVAS